MKPRPEISTAPQDLDHADCSRAILNRALRLDGSAGPFPWQCALLDIFLKDDAKLPEGVDVPTGLGKTAVMAIWLVARACGANLPRRLIYIVDRRVVVDQATAVAEGLRQFIAEDPDIQRQLGLVGSLPISTLRGQHLDNREWLEDPSAPAIIIGTVDMIGSRLLFEGYGVSRKMRPFHAGLLGADSLVVLDEAHLVPPFQALLESLARPPDGLRPDNQPTLGFPAFRLLTLSATGKEKANVQGLTRDDLAQGTETRKRLVAKKSLLFKSHNTEGDFATWMAQQAWQLYTDMRTPQRILVFCNARRTAEQVARAIAGKAKEIREEIACELLVGARRVRERQIGAERLREQGWFTGFARRPEEPMFLVATSAGEVGVDLDADHMACDLVEWERMVQRLGRVNRRGQGDAKVLVLLEKEPQPTAKEKAALDKHAADRNRTEENIVKKFDEKLARDPTLRAPFDLLESCDEGRDVSPLALQDLRERGRRSDDPEAEKVATVLHDASTPPPLRPALTRPVVDAWSMTSLKEHTGRPEINPWLRGWVEGEPPQTRVVWRTHLPLFPGHEQTHLVPFPEKWIARYFEAAPVHLSEVLETRADQVFVWIQKRAKALVKLDEDKRPLNPEDSIGFLLDTSGEPTGEPLSLGDLSLDSSGKKDKDTLKRRLAFHTLVLDARFGGLAGSGLLDGKAKEVVPTVDGAEVWIESDSSSPIIPFRITPNANDTPGWLPTTKFPLNDSEDGPATEFLYIYKWRTKGGDADDQSIAAEQSLQSHQELAECKMREIANRLGLDTTLADLLCLAARIHDEGKDCARWQDAFNAPSIRRPFAKTKGPINQPRLGGYRHELVSMLRAKDHPDVRSLPSADDRDLLLHLIASHHGFARPFIGLEGCDDYPPSKLRAVAVEIALRFARVQKRWGPWGLAWLESLLRAADQQASRDPDSNQPGNQEASQ